MGPPHVSVKSEDWALRSGGQADGGGTRPDPPDRVRTPDRLSRQIGAGTAEYRFSVAWASPLR